MLWFFIFGALMVAMMLLVKWLSNVDINLPRDQAADFECELKFAPWAASIGEVILLIAAANGAIAPYMIVPACAWGAGEFLSALLVLRTGNRFWNLLSSPFTFYALWMATSHPDAALRQILWNTVVAYALYCISRHGLAWFFSAKWAGMVKPNGAIHSNLNAPTRQSTQTIRRLTGNGCEM